MKTLSPYANESDAISIGNLNIENRMDRLAIYGSIELTKDQPGLIAALLLKRIIDDAVAILQGQELPDKIQIAPSDKIPNPFEKS